MSELSSDLEYSSKKDSSPLNPDSLPNTVEENKPTTLIKNNKEPVMITLTAVDLNPARLLHRIQRGGDRLFPE